MRAGAFQQRFAWTWSTWMTGRLATLTGLVTLAVATATAVVGQLRAVSHNPEDAWPWLIVAALLALGGVKLVEQDVPPAMVAEGATFIQAGRRRRVGGLALASVGTAAAIAATALVAAHQTQGATLIWFDGLLAAACGALVLGRGYPRPNRPSRLRLLELAAFFGIFGLAAWLRLPNLAAVPPNVHGDEADVGLLAREILAGRMPAIFATSPAAEATALTFAVHATTMRIFGDDLFGLRMASAIEGLLTVALLYLFARRVWGPRVALLAATFMSVAAWHIHFSRTGFHYMQAPLAMLLALYFMMRGLQDRRLLDWLLAGFALGLSIDVYYAARLAPVVVAAYLAYRALREPTFLQQQRAGIAALAFGAVIFVAPMLAVYGANQGSFIQRAAAVLVTSANNLQHELDAYQVNNVQAVLAIQTVHSLEAFNIRGETSLEYGHPAPLFDLWTGAFLAMASLAILTRPGSAAGFMLATWVWVAMVLGSIMTTDAMFSPHLVVAIPALVLGSALLVDRAWSGVGMLMGRGGLYAFALPVVVVLAIALRDNFHDYFDVQIVQRQPAGRFTLLANYARSINDRYRLYVIGSADWTLDYDTPRFLIPSPDAVDVRNAALSLPLDHIPTTRGVAFVVENAATDYAQRMDTIRSAYPTGREEVISERPGQPTLTGYLVENADLLKANPGATRD